MVVYKDFSMETYHKFLKTNFNSNFGCDEDKIIAYVEKYAPNHPTSPIVTWHITAQDLKKTYIPFLKKHFHGGYVTFLGIVLAEGGGAGNWINHYQSDTSSTYLGMMLDDINLIKSSLYTYNKRVCRSAVDVEHKAPYIPDNGNEDVKFLNSIKKGKIGRYYMTETMAGNAWVWGTKWTLAHQGTSSPSAYYGNPYDTIIHMIQNCGGKIDGKGGSAGSASGNKIDSGKGVGNIGQSIVSELEKALEFDVHNISRTNYYENAFISLERTYNNTYKIRFRHDFINNLIDNSIKNSNDHDPDNKKSDDFNDSSVTSTKWIYPIRNFYKYTSFFGPRWNTWHDGVDIGSSVWGSDLGIYAVHSGTIVYKGYHPKLLWFFIEKIGKYYVYYQEFSYYEKDILVNVGDKVKTKQKVAIRTRTDPNAHLHIGVTKEKDLNKALASAFKNDGVWLNPTKFLKKKWK